jgi:hypothetical protein
MDNSFLALLVASLSMIASVASAIYRALWGKANRPLVTARISTHTGGNVGIMLDILVENFGTRPALRVELNARESDVRAALIRPDADGPRDAKRVLLSGLVIPVVANGRTVYNAFGNLGKEGIWRPGARIPITVHYRGLGGANYDEAGELLLQDDNGFAQTSWEGPANQDTKLPGVVNRTATSPKSALIGRPRSDAL